MTIRAQPGTSSRSAVTRGRAGDEGADVGQELVRRAPMTPIRRPGGSKPRRRWLTGARALRSCRRVSPGQPEKGKCERHDGKKDPAGIEARMGHEVPEDDGDEEAAYGGQCEHQAGCR